MSNGTLMTLRELRMWHWRQAMVHRNTQRNCEKSLESSTLLSHNRRYFTYRAQKARDAADFHLSAVQALNDLFSSGDTAEQDCLDEARGG